MTQPTIAAAPAPAADVNELLDRMRELAAADTSELADVVRNLDAQLGDGKIPGDWLTTVLNGLPVTVQSISHRHGTDLAVYATAAAAHAALATWARTYWNEVAAEPYVPGVAPDDDDEAVDLYFELHQGESYDSNVTRVIVDDHGVPDDDERVFHFEGDDHETETVTADNEADARQSCADAFNARYACDCSVNQGYGNHDEDCWGADYDGSEFDLLGVYRGDPDDPDTWIRVNTWRSGKEEATSPAAGTDVGPATAN